MREDVAVDPGDEGEVLIQPTLVLLRNLDRSKKNRSESNSLMHELFLRTENSIKMLD